MDLYYWLMQFLGIVIPTVSSKFCVFSTTGQQAQSCHSVVAILFLPITFEKEKKKLIL